MATRKTAAKQQKTVAGKAANRKTAPKAQPSAKKASGKTTAGDEDRRVYVSKDDCYLFGQGTHYDIYRKLGAHPSVENGVEGTFFAVWAPNAASVHVIGSFNGWNEEQYPMEKIGEIGLWTRFIPGVG